MTTDEQQLLARLFGPAATQSDDNPQTAEHLVVRAEGDNPAPGPISDEQRNADFVRRLFDSDYDQIQQLPPPEEAP